MGKLTGGPFYFLVGRTGNNVGRVIRGKNYFYMRPQPSSKQATDPQLAVRMAFGMVSSWLSWVTPVIETGFQGQDNNMSAMNAAVSYNIKNAVTGVYPSLTLDYAEAMFSRGRLSGPYNWVVETTADAQLDISWEQELENGVGSLTDLATFVVYNPAKGVFAVRVGAVSRSAQSYDMELPSGFSGDSVHAYMHFVSADGKAVSTTSYLGSFIVM